MSSISSRVLNAYRPILLDKSADAGKIGGTWYPIPKFHEIDLTELCQKSINVLSNQPRVLTLPFSTYVVGDLHGNLSDLLRILSNIPYPPQSNILFLGDYVDRGDYSVEVITLLLALMNLFPSNIFLLRGNHEFRSLGAQYGFKASVVHDYSIDLYEMFNTVFDYLPLAAVVQNSIFCVHGGISPRLKNVNEINSIPKPISDYNETVFADLFRDLMWSDPSQNTLMYNSNSRGYGCEFGIEASRKFLNENNLEHIMRAHQCVLKGVLATGKKEVYTVFSCSCYQQGIDNYCGVVQICENAQINSFNMQPMRPIPRELATFIIKERPNLPLLGPNSIKAFRPGVIGVPTTRIQQRGKIRRFTSGTPTPHKITISLSHNHNDEVRIKFSSNFFLLDGISDSQYGLTIKDD